ncbi:MAG TPA: hypothetical protein VFF65_02080 [Phycisphaerales bacterium]|nr:hypothetical protein [Phycisphaerales bacterium]
MSHTPLADPAKVDLLPRALPAVLDAWQVSMRVRYQYNEEHVRKCRRDVERCIDAQATPWRTVDDLQRAGAEAFATQVREQGRRGRTHDRIVSSLRSFGAFLVERELLTVNPFQHVRRLGRKAKDRGRGTRPLTPDELGTMTAVAEEQEARDGRVKHRRSRVYRVARWTGYRKEEFRRFVWPMVHDLFGERCTVEVYGKNGLIEYLPLHPDGIKALQEQWHDAGRFDPGGLVFPVLPKPNTVDCDMWRAGIIRRLSRWRFDKRDARGFTVGFHSIRKTLNREMRRAGVDDGLRRRIMRHRKDSDLSDNEYDMPDYDELRDAVQKGVSIDQLIRDAKARIGAGGAVDNSPDDPPPNKPTGKRRSGRYTAAYHTRNVPFPAQHDNESRQRSPGGVCDSSASQTRGGSRSRDPEPLPQTHRQRQVPTRRLRQGFESPCLHFPKENAGVTNAGVVRFGAAMPCRRSSALG